MDIFSSLWALIREPFFKYSVGASLGYTIVEYIDEQLLHDAESPKGSGVGLLTLVSGFFGIIISGIIFCYAFFTGSVANLIMGTKQIMMVLASGGLEVIWMIPYLQATTRVGTIKAAPLFQLIPVFGFLFGFFVFDETIGVMHVIGSLVIVSGAFLLNFSQDTLTLDKKTVWQMVLASLIIAFVYSVFKDAAIEGNFMAALFWSGIGMTLMSTIIWLLYRPYREELNHFLQSPSKRMVYLQVTNEGVNAASVTASHYAVVAAPSVMVGTALNAFHPLFILFFGWIMGKLGSNKHHEQLARGEGVKTLVAILLIILGLVLIAL